MQSCRRGDGDNGVAIRPRSASPVSPRVGEMYIYFFYIFELVVFVNVMRVANSTRFAENIVCKMWRVRRGVARRSRVMYKVHRRPVLVLWPGSGPRRHGLSNFLG